MSATLRLTRKHPLTELRAAHSRSSIPDSGAYDWDQPITAAASTRITITGT